MPAKKLAPDFQQVFVRLRRILAAHAASMSVAHDEPDHYLLNTTKPHPTNGHALMFGAVQIGKNYVSFHLMPVYCSPELQAAISPALKKRMQGKACFNFTTVDEALFAELADLTERGRKAFVKMKFA